MGQEYKARSLGARQARVYLEIRNAIESGLLRPSQKLSSQAQLAVDHGVALATVHETLGALERDGYIVRRHGVGTFVAESPPPAADPLRALARFTLQTFTSTQQMIDAALILVAQQIGVRSAFFSKVDGDRLMIIADYDNAGCGIHAGSNFPLADAF